MQRRDLLAFAMGAPFTVDGKTRRSRFKISWREGPEYPMGIQDSAVACLNGRIVSAGGFTRHPKDILATYPDVFGGKKNGFTNAAFVFDPARPEGGWTRIPDVPGPPRQGAAAAVAGGSMYVMGGFNYSDPFTYRWVYKLREDGGRWSWSEVDASLPWPVSEAGVAVIGTRIYLVSGADFCAQPGSKDQDFSVEGRNGDPVGRGLLTLDTANLTAGWARLPDLPGTARFDTCANAADGKIYVLTGVHRAPQPKTGGYSNVVDCWMFDPVASRWKRLPDMPHGANQRAIPYRDRYLVLVAGYRYGNTRRPDGSAADAYTPTEKKLDWKQFFETTVMVFDTRTERLSSAEPLVDKTSWPGAAVNGNTIYVLGGEGGRRLWHPATFQIGEIRE